MRVYDPETEALPDFNLTTYIYFGLDGEYAPLDTTEVIIHPSVETIKEEAFHHCSKMRRCIMHENVENIKCRAFHECVSLDALFLPPRLQSSGDCAFVGCTYMRVLSIPPNINIEKIGKKIVRGCRTFFEIFGIQEYLMQNPLPRMNAVNGVEIHQEIINCYRRISVMAVIWIAHLRARVRRIICRSMTWIAIFR